MTDADGPTSGEPPSEPPLREYELPTARQVVTRGLQLAFAASAELRRASLYIGLLSLLLLGPALVFAVAVIARYDLTDLESFFLFQPDPQVLAAIVAAFVLLYGAILAWVTVTIDGQLIAVALLAARAGDRPFTLREATIRARQVFWRMVGGSFIAGLASGIVQVILTLILFASLGPSQGLNFFISLLAVILVAPLGYLATGIVVGDVGPWEALVRSVRLARARPSIALVVALFTLVTAAIQLFALSAGLDLLVRVGEFFHVGLTGGPLPIALTILGLLAFIVAFGSLTFTVAAIVVAPQVAAFLGLTFYSAGLDRAVEAEGRPKLPFRWITLPMTGLIVLLAVGSVAGVAAIDPFAGRAADPTSELLAIATTWQSPATVDRSPVAVDDPGRDQIGTQVPAVDIAHAEYVTLADVPPWLLRGVFGCGQPNVACSEDGAPESAFEDGALLVLQRMAVEPGTIEPAVTLELGPLFDIDGFELAPATSGRFPQANVAVLTVMTTERRFVEFLAWDAGSFKRYQTFARSLWIGSNLLTLIPYGDELDRAPLGWDVYAGSARARASVASHDTLRTLDGGSMLPFRRPPVLRLLSASPAMAP